MSWSVHFGAFEFDSNRRELRKHGLKVRVPDQSLQILAALVERPGETVTRERIQGLLWPNGTVVGFDQSINTAVKRLREALGDPADSARFIERVPHQGYRFVAPVELLPRVNASWQDRAGTELLHYRLLEKAGSGSMGEVWKAEDTKLGRIVALKLVPQRLAADDDTLEALRQEARHAASLSHPNICTIHGLEEHDGQRFLVMEYIEGQPLSAALGMGPLPVQRVLDVGIQAAEALATAHKGGVIHRDVKPANLMLTADGRVKLTDFGIAKAGRRESGRVAEDAHTLAGTLGYISPEQVRGEPADARSDLFSLGAVLCEMATGRRPFRGDTPMEVLHAVLHQEPVRPRALNRSLPRELDRVILRALEKEPAARWQDASAMAEALRTIDTRRTSRFLPAAALAAAGLAAALAVWLWTRPPPVLTERDSVVVADFENKTGDAVFDGTLRQALLTQMGQSRYVNIVSEDRIRSALGSMRRPAGDRLARGVAREICERTGARAVLAGSIGILGSRYFVGLEAIGCAGGEALASEYAEAGSRERVLTAVSTVASKMRRRLGESLASVRKLGPLAEATTPSLEALRVYSIALHEKATGNDPAPHLERAIQIDPDFAAAHFTLARVYQARGQDAKAEEAITRAFARRERSSERERLAIEGLYHQIVTGDAFQAIAASTLAAQLYPQDASSWRWSLLAYLNVGEVDKALQVAQREIETAPDDGASYFDLAGIYIILGRTIEARELLDQATARGAGADTLPFARYLTAFLTGDSAAMEREAESARNKPFEHRLLMLQAQIAGFFGQLAKERDIARNTAARGMSSAAAIAATVALTEAVFGLEHEARARAKAAIRLDRGRRTAATCALALALANEPAASEAVLADLMRRYPSDTLLNSIWSPAVRGAIALKRGDAHQSLEAVDTPPRVARFAWPQYVRGAAYLRLGLASQAADEFRKIIESKDRLFLSVFSYGAAFAYPAAQLGLARALAGDGKADASRQAYEEFFAGWKEADPDIPMLVEAKREYAALAQALPRGVAHR